MGTLQRYVTFNDKLLSDYFSYMLFILLPIFSAALCKTLKPDIIPLRYVFKIIQTSTNGLNINCNTFTNALNFLQLINNSSNRSLCCSWALRSKEFSALRLHISLSIFDIVSLNVVIKFAAMSLYAVLCTSNNNFILHMTQLWCYLHLYEDTPAYARIVRALSTTSHQV